MFVEVVGWVLAPPLAGGDDPGGVAALAVAEVVSEVVVEELLVLVEVVVLPFWRVAFMSTDWKMFMKSWGTLTPFVAVALPLAPLPLGGPIATVTAGSISIPTIIGSTLISTSPTV